jgi:hypothetical protein
MSLHVPGNVEEFLQDKTHELETGECDREMLRGEASLRFNLSPHQEKIYFGFG